MGKPSIGSVYNKASSRLLVVERFLTQAKALPPNLYGFVCELMLLRIFSTIEYTVRETALRLACGSPYKNGVKPSHILYNCKTIFDATEQFKKYGRSKQKTNLQFTNVHHTNDSIKFVIDSSEAFRIKLNVYSVIFEEMRKVRNHIAHRTSSTLKDYNQVLRSRYGGYIKLTPSAFLISTKRHSLSIIAEYLQTSKIMIDEITNS